MANHPDVENLRLVDDLDTKIFRLKRDIADMPSDLNKVKAATKSTADALAHVQAEQKRLHKEIDKIALETKSGEEQIKKYQVQQNTAKTNEEYATLKRQIDVIKKQNGEYEDKALAFYEEVDRLKADEAKAKKSLKDAEAKAKEAEAELQKEVAQLEKEVAGLQQQKAEAEAKVGSGSLAMYRRVHEKLAGKRALAAVKGRTCQGCFIEINPNSLSILLSGKELVVCPQCSRMLYLEEDYRAFSPTSYLVTEKDRDSTSKDGNW